MTFFTPLENLFHRVLARVVPSEAWRVRLLQIVTRGRKIFLEQGPGVFLRVTVRRLYFYGRLRLAYQQWVQENTPSAETLTRQRAQAQRFASRPLISLITPVYNPPPVILRATLESVLSQTYPNWEMCLVDGASDREGLQALLTEYTQKDPRFRLQTLTKNLGISGNSNEALKMAQGEYVQILDHDDTLTPDALFEIVQTLNEKPATDLLYFDEDKLSEDGLKRRGPLFKPGWSPELLLSANYLSHCLMRRTLALEVGMFDPRMDGAQDWDLALRITERSPHVAHIPKVLYHWRQISGSTAIVTEAKEGVFNAQLRSVENHLKRRGIAQAQGVVIPPSCLRFQWPVRGAKVSIILPAENLKDVQARLTALTQRTHYPDYEIIVVGAHNPLSDAPNPPQGPRVRSVPTSSTSLPAALNLGAQHAHGDLLLFLDPHLDPLDPDWLEELVRWAERPEIGIVGAKLLSRKGLIQHAGMIFAKTGQAHYIFHGAREREFGVFGLIEWYRNYSAVSGACMMMRREIYESVGPFDETHPDQSDLTLCAQARQKGHRILYTPFARLRFFNHKTWDAHPPSKNAETWRKNDDPYFNPNLTVSGLLPSTSRQQK